jgi:hypothetical protein
LGGWVRSHAQATRELGLGSRGLNPKGPWAALDALGGEPGVALEPGDLSSLGARQGRRRRRFFFRHGTGASALGDEVVKVAYKRRH